MALGRESSASQLGHHPSPDVREVKAVTPMSYLPKFCYLMLYFDLETAGVHKGQDGHGLVGWWVGVTGGSSPWRALSTSGTV